MSRASASRRLFRGFAVLAAAAPQIARAQCAKGAEYTQSEAMKSRYPDPPAKEEK